MNVKILKKAIELAETTGTIFIATADERGVPHVRQQQKQPSRPKDGWR
jgi:hypothetical protein